MSPAGRTAAWIAGSVVAAAVLSVLAVQLLRPAPVAANTAPPAPITSPAAPAGAAPTSAAPDPDEPVEVGDFPGALALSPDGTRAYVASGRGVIVFDAATRETIGTIGTEQTARSVALSPDGRRMVFATYQNLVVLDLTTNLLTNAVALAEPYNYVEQMVGINADGTQVYLVAGSEQPALLRADLTAGTLTPVADIGRSQEVLLNADATTAWVGANRSGNAPVRSVDLTTGAITPVPGTEETTGIALAPDGTGPLYAFTYNERLEIDQATRAVSAPAPWLDTAFGTVVVGPGGDRLYAVGSNGQVQIFDPAAGEQVDTEVGGLRTGGSPTAVALSPDGNSMWVLGDNGVSKVDVAPYR